MRLTGYQQAIAESDARYVAVTKARRAGGSYAATFRHTPRLLGLRIGPSGFERAGRCIPQRIVSASQDQADELLAEMADHVKAFNATWPDDECRMVEQLKSKITLANGVTVKAFADNPRSIRGGGADVIWDEAAFSKDDKAMWAALQPMVSPSIKWPDGFRLTVVTSAWAEGSLAHAMCVGDGTEVDRFRHVHRFTIPLETAVSMGFPKPMTLEEQAAYVQAVRDEVADEDVYAREYGCVWGSGEGQYFGFDLLRLSRYDADELGYRLARHQAHTLYLGVDVGRKKDLTAIAPLLVFDDGDMFALPVETLRRVAFIDQETAIAKYVEADGARMVNVDATGIGLAFFEQLERRFPGRVTGTTFTMAVKDELASEVKLGLESGRLHLPDDIELQRDLASIRRQFSNAGNTVFKTDQSTRGHGDRAWALALAVQAAEGGRRRDGGKVLTGGRRLFTLPRGKRNRWAF